MAPLLLLTKADIEKTDQILPAWLQGEYACWKEVVSDKGFPCPFGTVAERKGLLRYFYVENDDFNFLPDALREFLKVSRSSKDRHAFIVFFRPEIPEKPFAYYENYFWDVLQFLHEHDQREWCKDIPMDPDDVKWEFCFDGEPIFVSANMPGYKHRVTRHIGNSLILIFQPRRIFNGISYQTKQGKKAIELIRSRVEAIESLPFHPDLGAYGDENYREWKQYVITDDGEPRSGRCPFLANRISKK